jgi:hypothetical protein
MILAVIMYGNMNVIRHNSGTEPVNRTINDAEHECFVLWDATYCCKILPDYKIIKEGNETYVTDCVKYSIATQKRPRDVPQAMICLIRNWRLKHTLLLEREHVIQRSHVHTS